MVQFIGFAAGTLTVVSEPDEAVATVRSASTKGESPLILAGGSNVVVGDSGFPGEVVLRIEAVGICGSDISGYLGKMPFFSYPRIPGHELGVERIDLLELQHASAGEHP